MGNTAEQLLCMAGKCGKKALNILASQDAKDLLTCAAKDDLQGLCSSIWSCLGDDQCNAALKCWSKPFDTCKTDMWKVLTDAKERQRIELNVKCVRGCEKAHSDDFVQASMCVLDACSESVLECYHDATCRSAVQCVPNTIGQCAMPFLERYTKQELLRNSTKCVARGLELCGAASVEMLRNQDIAEAISCASQCSIAPAHDGMAVVV